MNKNIPNILTISRGIVTIIIAVVMLSDVTHKFSITLGLFIYAGLTDFLDGYLARKYKIISVFGTVFDSLFDKILILVMYMLIIPYQVVHPGILVALLFRELFIDGIKNYLLSKNRAVSSKWSGKIKFSFQVAMIILILLYLIHPQELIYYPMIICSYLTVFFAYYSAYFYIIDFINYEKKSL